MYSTRSRANTVKAPIFIKLGGNCHTKLTSEVYKLHSPNTNLMETLEFRNLHKYVEQNIGNCDWSAAVLLVCSIFTRKSRLS